ncbi:MULTISPECIES: hypothetical protein [unclassified Candidatus Tisiphia]|uniref:hypothetical protein n=1 Tax=unclassified Candidatus Tisiphia TaxID=2996318 RepID=UPI003CCAA03D
MSKNTNWTTAQMQAIARLNAHRNAKLLYSNPANSDKKSLAQLDYPKYPGYDDDLKLVKGDASFSYSIDFVAGGFWAAGIHLTFTANGKAFSYAGGGGGNIVGGAAGHTWLNSDIDITSLVDQSNAIRFECGFGGLGAGAAHVNLYHTDAADTWFAGTGTFFVTTTGWGEIGGVGTLSYA